MKTKYLKGIIALSFAAALLFSSCLKDARQFLPESVTPNLAQLPLSGLYYFSRDAITKSGIDTIIFAVGVTAANPPKASTAVTLAVDLTIVNTYDAANTAITYLPFPAGSYTLVTPTVTIPAGSNSTLATLIVDKTQLDPSKSYMIPVKIVSASGLPISGNYSIHYYHVIGNDFAGSYTHNFYRYNNFSTPPPAGTTPSAGSFYGANAQPVTILPVSPTEFQVVSGYFTGNVNYDVTFTKTDATHYTDFQITQVAADVATNFTPSGIIVTQQPVFGYGAVPPYDPTAIYTYAEALSLFTFQYTVQNSSGFRYNVDNYVHN